MIGSFNSYSNNIGNLFACQLNLKQTNNYHAFLQDNLTETQFRVFNTIMQLTVSHKSTFPSYKTIAKMSHCARSTAQLAVSKLKELHIIQTEYRGYHKSLIFRMHEFYFNNRNNLTTLVRNVVFMSLSILLSKPTKPVNRYLLKEEVVYLNQSTFSGDKSMSFQLTDDHFAEIRKQPTYVYDRALVLYQRKIDSGTNVASPSAYFMGIFRQESAKTQPSEFKQPTKSFKNTETEKKKEFVRPTDGPYAIYKHEERKLIESDFDISIKLEMALHSKPNMFSKIVADMNLNKLSQTEIDQIMEIVHKDCSCRK